VYHRPGNNCSPRPFVEQFIGRHPGVALRIYEGVSNVLRDYMFGRLLDIAIIPFEPSPPPSYQQTPLVREPMVLVGPGKDGLRADHPVTLSNIDGVKLVLPGMPNVARVQLERAMERKGLKFRIAVESDMLALNLDLVRREVGCTVVPACALHSHGLGESISWAPIRGQFVTWALCENIDRMHSLPLRERRRLGIAVVAHALESEVWVGSEALSDDHTGFNKSEERSSSMK